MSEQKNEKEIEEEEIIINPDDFSFKPGSSIKPLHRYHTQQRKIEMAEESLSARPDIASEVKVGLVTDLFPVRIIRKIYRSGGKKKPTNGWPTAWMRVLGIDYEHPENGHNVMMWELSADRKEIRGRKMPAPPGMEKSVDARIFEADSDAAAIIDEQKQKQ
jgi:hypothetical protein